MKRQRATAAEQENVEAPGTGTTLSPSHHNVRPRGEQDRGRGKMLQVCLLKAARQNTDEAGALSGNRGVGNLSILHREIHLQIRLETGQKSGLLRLIN